MRAAYAIEITQSTPQRERRQDDHARGDVPAKPKPSAQTETHVKAFNLQGGQIQCVQAAIERPKITSPKRWKPYVKTMRKVQ